MYFVFTACLRRGRYEAVLPVCASLVAVIMLVFSLFGYIGDLSSGLVFVFFPLYLLIGGPLLLWICLFVAVVVTSYRRR